MNFRTANSPGEATHRYTTSVHWGDGYFNDGFRYIVAPNLEDAYRAMKHRCPSYKLYNLQVRVNATTWRYADVLPIAA